MDNVIGNINEEFIENENIIIFSICGLLTGLFLNSNLTIILTIMIGYFIGKSVMTIQDISQITGAQKTQIKQFLNGMVVGVILSQFNFHCLFLGVALRILVNPSNFEKIKNKGKSLAKQIQERWYSLFTK